MTATTRKLIPLLVFVGVIAAIHNGWRIRLWLQPIDHSGLAAADVIIYSTSWCPYCAKTRDFFDSASIPYTEHDIERSPSAMREYQALSGRGVPVIRVGDTVIQGYDPAAIRTAIEQYSGR